MQYIYTYRVDTLTRFSAGEGNWKKLFLTSHIILRLKEEKKVLNHRLNNQGHEARCDEHVHLQFRRWIFENFRRNIARKIIAAK